MGTETKNLNQGTILQEGINIRIYGTKFLT